MEKNTIILIIILSAILGLFIYGLYTKSQPPKVEKPQEEQPKNNSQLLFWGVLIGLGILIALAIWHFTKKTSPIHDAISIDEWDEILKERLIKKHGVKGYYDEKGNLQFAPGAVTESDQRPFIPTGTSQQFFIKELQITDPESYDDPAIITTMVNLNKPKKILSTGSYSLHWHTSMFDWLKEKSYLKKLPVSSPEHESLQLAQYMAQFELDPEDIERYRQIYNRTVPVEDQLDEDSEKVIQPSEKGRGKQYGTKKPRPQV